MITQAQYTIVDLSDPIVSGTAEIPQYMPQIHDTISRHEMRRIYTV